jgi:hypothetical protein
MPHKQAWTVGFTFPPGVHAIIPPPGGMSENAGTKVVDLLAAALVEEFAKQPQTPSHGTARSAWDRPNTRCDGRLRSSLAQLPKAGCVKVGMRLGPQGL